MAGLPFQIPGLGEAKPNEQLPVDSFAPDFLAAAASILGENGEIVGGTNEEEQLEKRKQRKQQEKEGPALTADEADDSMELDISDTSTLSAHLKDSQDHQDTKMSDNEPKSTESQAADIEMKTGNEAPASPGVTYALEAALEGLFPKAGAPAEQATVQTEQPQTRNTEQPRTSNTEQQQNGVNIEQEGENPEWEADSSPYESSSESSSDSSSDDDSEDEGGYQLLGIEETARLLMAADGDGEGDGDGGKAKGAGTALRTKNEKPEEVIPKPDITITPEMNIERLGNIEFIVENTIVIKSHVPGEVQVLDSGSVLCKEDRTVIGALADILGNVRNPVYTVGFSSEDEIKDYGLETKMPIYYSVDHANYVFTQPLREVKGTDASNLHDEEVPAEEMEFSDDEKEAEYKRAQKMKKRGGKAGRGTRELSVASTHTMTSQPSNIGLNYDDDEDGPYKPLARPPGFGMGSGASLPLRPEAGFSPPRGGRGRGPRGAHRGGRGDFRGRDYRGGHRGGDRRHASRGSSSSFSQYSRDGPASPQSYTSTPPAPPEPHLPPPPSSEAAVARRAMAHPPGFIPPPQFAQSPFTFNYPAWNPNQAQQQPQYQYPPAATHHHQSPRPSNSPSSSPATANISPTCPSASRLVARRPCRPLVSPPAAAYGQHYFGGYQPPQQQQQQQQQQQVQQPQQQQQGQQQYWPQQQQHQPYGGYGQGPSQ
ncbi:hypothetical protein N0V88_006910 [Collariella sp. IMI 366227]|nr:hypothetical protein N0V88_006910 [Collariella sp. IMI 366227]